MVPQSEKLILRNIFTGYYLKTWVIIFFVAFLCRLLFLNIGTQLPVFWDARLYTSAAIGLLGYVDRDNSFADGKAGLNEYREEYRTYLNGEDINWLYYKPPTLSEAQKYVFYSGPVYPAIMAAIFALPWSNDFQAVRYFNAFVDSLAVVFISIIAFTIFRKRWVVWLAAIVQMLYFPLIISCGVLGLETITSFFISLLLLLVCLYYFTEYKWCMISAGIVGGVLFLCKPTAALLTVPVFVFLLFLYFRQWKQLLKMYVLYLIPFLFLTIPWVIFTSNYYGTFAIRDPEYSTANIRSSSSIPYEGYDLDKSDADFWTYPVLERILEDPIGYINLLSKKFVRLWWTPHDEFWQGPRLYELFYHRLIVLIGLIGIATIPLRRQRMLELFVLLGLYYTGIHVIFHSVPRYNFNALPALFLLSIAGMVFLAEHWKQIIDNKKTLIVLLSAIMTLFVSNFSSLSENIAAMMPIVIPIGISILLLIVIGVSFQRLFHLSYARIWQRLFLWGPIGLLCLATITGWARPQLQEWHVNIANVQSAFVTEIDLPHNFRMTNKDKIILAMDLTSDTATLTPIKVTINGYAVKFVDGMPPFDRQFYIKGTYEAFEKYMKRDRRGLRWYRYLRLKPDKLAELLGKDKKLKIAIQIDDSSYSGNGLTIYGGYTENGTSDSVIIPSLRHNSIERFKEFGDRRLFERHHFYSLGQKSYIITQIDSRVADTSHFISWPGRGRAHIILYIQRPDFSERYY